MIRAKRKQWVRILSVGDRRARHLRALDGPVASEIERGTWFTRKRERVTFLFGGSRLSPSFFVLSPSRAHTYLLFYGRSVRTLNPSPPLRPCYFLPASLFFYQRTRGEKAECVKLNELNICRAPFTILININKMPIEKLNPTLFTTL